jgi:predicted DNA-binding transcriptional regulator AlpA
MSQTTIEEEDKKQGTVTIMEKLGYMSIEDAAAFLGLSKLTLLNMRCDGTGPKSYKHGKKIIYKQSDLIAWFETSLIKRVKR